MPIRVLPFPAIDPVLLHLGPLPIRWYGLAYVFGLLAGWMLARFLCARPALWGRRTPPSAESLDDLMFYSTLGAILGGRLFHVLFWDPAYYLAHPVEAFMLWDGGMGFHGGLAGVGLGAFLFARKYGLAPLVVADICSAVAPIGLFFGRLANFIKPELWGRPSDVPWAMIFPGAGPEPRHPSQLYEAGLEGLLLFVLLMGLIRAGGLKRAGLISGVFGVGYGLARIFCEFFREPDPKLEAINAHLTWGMALSVPLVIVGLWLIARARKEEASS